MVTNLIEFLDNNSTLLFFILGSILVPGIYVWWQTNEGKKIALAGGVYDKAIMEINALYNYYRENTKLNVYIGIHFNSYEQFALLHLPLYFNNIGTKSLESVSFSFEYALNSNLPIETLVSKSNPDNLNISKLREYIKYDNSIAVHYKIGDMYPKIAYGHYEIIKIKRNNINTIERLSIIMRAKDQLPLIIEIDLHIVDTNKLERLLVIASNMQNQKDDKRPFIAALPIFSSKKIGKLKYQECIIKESQTPLPLPKIPKGWEIVPVDDYPIEK